MDSLTHIALGACIGEAVLAKQTGKRALLLGAVAQSLPDIDVVASLWLHPVNNLLVHRGFTHSLLFGVTAGALLPFIASKAVRLKNIPFIRLFFFFCLQMWLHDLLDTCNAYGTGLFEPFSSRRFSLHLLFVADPFFSVSLVIASVVLALLRKGHRKRKVWLLIGLLPASLYFIYAVFNKTAVQENVEKSLSAERIPYKDFFITPTPFNTWLWYVVAATDSGYTIGYRSVFDKKSLLMPFIYHPKNERLLQAADTTVNVKQLRRFADDYYTVDRRGDTLLFNVLRFGQVFGWQNAKADFAFQYFLHPAYDNTFLVQRGRFKGWNRRTLIRMYRRIEGE
ncbi:MAG: metal-dependent hydrolase [Bacteroidota bacterium]|nr:metal-dependent hydrolase [Bacteroidota bacterium]